MKTKKESAKTNETMNAEKMVEVITADLNVQHVELSRIRPNPNNPRKQFDEDYLLGLADSIRSVGIINPILVRPRKSEQDGESVVADTFEIICGECRYHASVMAEKQTIPCFVANVSDLTAKAIAITENTQRKNMTICEEAQAIKDYLELSDRDIAAAAAVFGFSKAYIQNRLKLLDLISELRALLDEESITVSMALELCKYESEVQQEVYDEHLKENCLRGSWRPLKTADFAKQLRDAYTTKLDDFYFDKSECETCPQNTLSQLLFRCDTDCARCLNKSCLKDKNTTYVINTAVEWAAKNYEIGVMKYNHNTEAVNYLLSVGYEITEVDYYSNRFIYPMDRPEEPKADQFKDIEEYESDMQRYKTLSEAYKEQTEEIEWGVNEETLKPYIVVKEKQVVFCYENLLFDAMKPNAGSKTKEQELEEKAKRFGEIKVEHIIEDTKKIFSIQKVPNTPICGVEEKISYYAMIQAIKPRYRELLGFKGIEEFSMPDDALLAIVNRLTAKQKNRIQRVFIISNLSDVYRDSPRYGFFEEFAALHYPEKLEEIKAIYSAKYDPKQQRAEMELEQFKASKPTEAEEMEANEPEQTEVESEEIPEIVEVPQEDQPQASPTEDAPVVVPEEPQDNPLQPELPEKPVTEPDEKPEPEREDAPDVQLPESDDDCPFIEPYDLIEPVKTKKSKHGRRSRPAA